MSIHRTREGKAGEDHVVSSTIPLVFTDLESHQPDTVHCTSARFF
jgi:hypothetical protein